ncbi:MAG: J domain-containing protein [Zavarzinella sp.]
MKNPFAVLGMEVTTDTALIRKRYLELVRAHSPERDPERFSEISEAYNRVRDLDQCLDWILFENDEKLTLEDFLETVSCPTIRNRLSINQIQSLMGRTES